MKLAGGDEAAVTLDSRGLRGDWDAVDGYGQPLAAMFRQPRGHILLFLVLSTVLHLGLFYLSKGLIVWPAPRFDHPSSKLRLQLLEAVPRPMTEPAPQVSPVPEATRLTEEQANAAKATASQSSQPLPKVPPKPPPKQSAQKLMQQMRAAVPAIAQQVERDEKPEAGVFDPRYRAILEQARREAERLQALGILPEKELQVEVTGIYGDYMDVRIGNSCWRVPIYNNADPLDDRIAMSSSNCSSAKKPKIDLRHLKPDHSEPR